MPRVVGPQTGPVEYTLAPGAAMVGVRLTPGAAPSVLGVPASEVVDLSVGADDLWGARPWRSARRWPPRPRRGRRRNAARSAPKTRKPTSRAARANYGSSSQEPSGERGSR
jgi:hypothetical protein